MPKATKLKKVDRDNNPYGVNQYTAPDPRQAQFLALYTNPKGKTFSNAYQSALAAGYTKKYAEVLTGHMPNWLSEAVSDLGMLQKAERNLNEALDLDIMEQAMSPFGPIYEKGKGGKKIPVMKRNPKLIAIKADVSQFVAKTIGRHKWRENAPPNTFIVPVVVVNEHHSKLDEILERNRNGSV